MRVPILSGITTDEAGDFRSAYPVNMVPVPKEQGISRGYLRPADGIVQHGTGQGADRGGIAWRGVEYRVSGSKLISVSSGGAVTVLGDVGVGGQVSFTYSFDRLAVASAGLLYYYDGETLSTVSDTDLGDCVDITFKDGYFLSTDGEFIVASDLTDPASFNPLRYGSSEADPDPVMGLDEMRSEVYAFNRYSIEAFENVGGENFPFRRIDGAMVPRGVIGTHAFCKLLGTFVFLGGGRNEPPQVHVMTPGDSSVISTREVDTILRGYTEEELASAVMEARVGHSHAMVLLHLPDLTLVYDANATKDAGAPVWHVLSSALVGHSQYKARNLVWCYDRWNVGDPTSSKLGRLSDTTAHHWGQVVGWEFGTQILYNDGFNAIVHEIELVALPGRVEFGKKPVLWTSYSADGQTWSQEKAISAGKQGERTKRLVWWGQGMIQHYRMQKFRGTSDARVSFAALEMRIEALNG